MLSIIIPVYNAENYIVRCVNSLMNQGFKNSEFEILLINDGSTDNSFRIISQLASKNSNIHVHDLGHGGTSIARNHGIKSSKGEYLFFIDIDDIIAPNSLHKLLKTIKKLDLDILGFKLERTNDITKPFEKISDSEIALEVMTGEEYLDQGRFYSDSSCWFLLKKNLIITHNIEFCEGRTTQDALFTVQVFLVSKRVACLPIVLYRYIINPNSVWTNKSKDHIRKRVDDLIYIAIKYNDEIKDLRNENAKRKMEDRRDLLIRNALKRVLESDLDMRSVKNYLDNLRLNGLYPLRSVRINNLRRVKFFLLNLMFRKKWRFLATLYLFKVFPKKLFEF